MKGVILIIIKISVLLCLIFSFSLNLNSANFNDLIKELESSYSDGNYYLTDRILDIMKMVLGHTDALDVQLKLEKLIENSKKWYTKERMNYRNNPLPTPNSNPTPTLKVKPTPKEEFTTLEILTGIKVLEFNWYKNGAEVLVRGEIMNISDKKMSFVEVIVTFYDSNKNVVGVESGFMDKASIYPMETSEFNITGKFRDNYKTCSIKINP